MASSILSADQAGVRERLPPFSVQEFSDLVSTAFNLGAQQPVLSLRKSRLPSSTSGHPHPHSISYFEGDTDDDHVYTPSNAQSAARPASRTAAQQRKARSSALSVLKQVRTRASAFVLRPSNTNINPSNASVVPNLPRFSFSSQHTVISAADSSSFAFLSRPHTPCPSSHPSSPFPFPLGTDLALTRTRTRTKSLQGHMSFLKLGQKREAPATISTAGDYPLGVRPELPSFFEDTGYPDRNPAAPSYSRPATPALSTVGSLRIHTRLPPLRKAKSASTSLFRGKGPKSKSDTAAVAQTCTTPDSSWSFEAGEFMSPRNPPPVPPLPMSLRGVLGRWESDGVGDGEGDSVMDVPEYVFARRGSATSTCTTSTMTSAKSTSSLAERIASLLPLALPLSKNKLRARSKLSLAVATATANSSPSTDSTRTYSPITPTNYAFPPSTTDCGQLHPQSDCGHNALREIPKVDSDELGRVLTLESDPFKKDIIEIARDATSTPRSGTPPLGAFYKDRRPRGLGLDLGGSEEIDVPSWRQKLGGGISRPATRKIPPIQTIFDSSFAASTAYTFPSSCSVRVGSDGQGDALPSTPTSFASSDERELPVSRFSTPSTLTSPRSMYSNFTQEEDDDDDVVKEDDIGGDATFIFGSASRPTSGTLERRSPLQRRATVDTCASPQSSGHPESPSRRRRLAIRTSLPPTPPISLPRYFYAKRSPHSPDTPTKRKASVRTVASEPSADRKEQFYRPDSPFPLMRGLSDGCSNSRLGKHRGGTRYRQAHANGMNTRNTGVQADDEEASDSIDDFRVILDVASKAAVKLSDKAVREDADALDDSFVLPASEAAQLLLRIGPADNDDEQASLSPDEDALTPRAFSPNESCVRLRVPSISQRETSTTESNKTLKQQGFERALRNNRCSRGSDHPSSGEMEPEHDWDRHTAQSHTRSRSSTFYSACSSPRPVSALHHS